MRASSQSSSVAERTQTLPDPDEAPLDHGVPLGQVFGPKVRSRAIRICVILLVLSSVLSYFVKPKPPIQELVTPDQELPSFEFRYPGDTTLSQRVANSFGSAFIFVETPYTENNIKAMDNVRSWAQERFQEDANFLHPIRAQVAAEPNNTLLGALGYNLFASAKFWLEGNLGEWLSDRIADCHNTAAYKSFQMCYFEVFGRDPESATLLAKYQTEKGKLALEVVFWAALWFAGILAGGTVICLAPGYKRFEVIRGVMASAWLLIAASCSVHAWMQNSIPSFLSALFAVVVGCYLAKPFMLLIREDSSLKVTFVQLKSKSVCLAVWLTVTLLSVLILTWIRGQAFNNPDPVTLLLSSFSGDFIHDPENEKRLVMRSVGIIWLVTSLWAFAQRRRDARAQEELDRSLSAL